VKGFLNKWLTFQTHISVGKPSLTTSKPFNLHCLALNIFAHRNEDTILLEMKATL